MELPRIEGILAWMYTDRMAVYRYTGTLDADGALHTTLDTTPVLENIPCRVSFEAKDSPTAGGDKNPTRQRPILFCHPNVPLQRGDFICAKRKEKELCSGRIGRPNVYGSSQQAQLYFEGES